MQLEYRVKKILERIRGEIGFHLSLFYCISFLLN